MHQHVQPGRRRGVRRRAAGGAEPAHLLLQRLRRGAAAAAGAEPGDEPALPGGGPGLRVLRGQPPDDGRRPAFLQGQDPSTQGRLRRPPAHHAPRRAPRGPRQRESVGQGVQAVEGDARPAEGALRGRRRRHRHRQWSRQEKRQSRRPRRRDGHRHGRVQSVAMR